MFPTEFEIDMHRQEMQPRSRKLPSRQVPTRRSAEPTFWQRLRTRLSSAQPTAPVHRDSESVKQQQPTEAIA